MTCRISAGSVSPPAARYCGYARFISTTEHVGCNNADKQTHNNQHHQNFDEGEAPLILAHGHHSLYLVFPSSDIADEVAIAEVEQALPAISQAIDEVMQAVRRRLADV